MPELEPSRVLKSDRTLVREVAQAVDMIVVPTLSPTDMGQAMESCAHKVLYNAAKELERIADFRK